MRLAFLAATALTAMALGTSPASASSGSDGWEPAPTPPYDLPAGARCDVPVHTEPVVDEVVQRVLARRADGSPSRVAYRGDLVVRVTNTDTGAFHDADVSGSAIVDYHADGSQKWYVVGPVLAGVGESGAIERPVGGVDHTVTCSARQACTSAAPEGRPGTRPTRPPNAAPPGPSPSPRV